MSVTSQAILIFAGSFGFLDDVPVGRIAEFEEKYLEFMDSVHRKLVGEIKKAGKFSDEIIDDLKKATTDFKKKF